MGRGFAISTYLIIININVFNFNNTFPVIWNFEIFLEKINFALFFFKIVKNKENLVKILKGRAMTLSPDTPIDP